MTAFPIHCRRILLATFALLAVGVSQAMAQSPFTLSGSPPLQPPANMKTGEGALIVSAGVQKMAPGLRVAVQEVARSETTKQATR